MQGNDSMVPDGSLADPEPARTEPAPDKRAQSPIGYCEICRLPLYGPSISEHMYQHIPMPEVKR